jgi:transcriptional regulator with XRE-family HTH domain
VSSHPKDKMSDQKKLRMLGARIRQRRLQLGLSQERLAELADIHENHLRRVELGQANPTYLVLLQVGEALEMSLLELLASPESERRSG